MKDELCDELVPGSVEPSSEMLWIGSIPSSVTSYWTRTALARSSEPL